MKPNRNFWNKNKIHNNASLFWGGAIWRFTFLLGVSICIRSSPRCHPGSRVPGLPVMAVGGFKSWVPVVGGGLGWVGREEKNPWNTHKRRVFWKETKEKHTYIYIYHWSDQKMCYIKCAEDNLEVALKRHKILEKIFCHDELTPIRLVQQLLANELIQVWNYTTVHIFLLWFRNIIIMKSCWCQCVILHDLTYNILSIKVWR